MTTEAAPKKTLDQRRAEHAWNAVTALSNGANSKGERVYPDGANEFAREAKKLPMRIMAAGLGHALAFINAKANKKQRLKQLHVEITDWVIKRRPIAKAKVPDSLLESIIGGDASFLRRATDEALAYLQWLNRFCEGEGLGKDGND